MNLFELFFIGVLAADKLVFKNANLLNFPKKSFILKACSDFPLKEEIFKNLLFFTQNQLTFFWFCAIIFIANLNGCIMPKGVFMMT